MPLNGRDIRPYKARLRTEAKQYRRGLTPEQKSRYDRKIANKLLGLWSFRDAETLLFYVSTAIEVDTHALIARAWELGKKVAVPRCVAGTRDMRFYYISSFDQLENGTFGVPEPIPALCTQVHDFSNSMCVVPALMFDREGYRLGYGKGYYDRFLASYPGTPVGICYAACRTQALPHGRYDKPIQIFITENRIYTTGV